MKPFSAPVEDILFSLDHVARAGRLPDWDSGFAAEILTHFAGFAEHEIAPLDGPGDRQGCRIENGRVQMPDGFAECYARYVEQGWHALSLPEAQGGQGLSGPLHGAVSEIFSGACHALQMITGLVPGAARTLERFGTPDQIAAHMPALASGAALATMCLTEGAAGSDLSGIRTRATRHGDGWQITGSKIFISGGDQPLSNHILHLVLARTGAAEDGVRGLSLFLCRNGGDFGPNGITVTRIEEKMGLHASPTCQLAFDAAPAERLGADGEGLKAMFTMMNHARLDVALQGVAHAARASDIARAYAAERKQGRRADGSPAVLSDHADVARMLDQQRFLTLGARAMCHLALVELERGTGPDLVEFLTPLCKIYGTEAGIRAADLGIQILGGYGYLSEYRVEQTYRDARITAIYEGTNGIHALALVTRLLKMENATASFAALLNDLAPDGRLKNDVAAWQELCAGVAQSPDPAAQAHRFVKATLALFERAIWQRIILAAPCHSAPEELMRLAHHAGAD